VFWFFAVRISTKSTRTKNIMNSPPSYNNHCRDKRYKAAIALNNSAITLLERDCFKDAVEMLRIAIYLAQLTFCSVGAFDPNTTLPQPIDLSDDDIHRHLMNAAQCQSKPRQASSCSMNTHTDLLKFSTQHNVSLVRESISKASQQGTRAVFSYIVIEPIDFGEVNLDSVYHDSMLILYNFGVAHYSLAGQIEVSKCICEQHRRILVYELRQTAYQMFYVIEGYVCRKLAEASVKRLQESGLLLLSALFSRTMSELALQLHYTTVSEYYTIAFRAILIMIDRQCQSFPDSALHAATA
jgi:hypothetical protein